MPEGSFIKKPQRNRLETVQLSEEKMKLFREGEKRILDLYSDEKGQENSKNQELEIPESEKGEI